MSDEKKIAGGCLCGAVRYEISQAPDEDVGYCHCRMCQKALGGLFGYFVIFTGVEKANAFQFTQGEPKLYRSSARAERGFCAECGTPLLFRDSKAVAVLIGSLDHPEDFPPTSHSGIESQVPWLKIDDGLPRWRTEDDAYVIRAKEAAHKEGSSAAFRHSVSSDQNQLSRAFNRWSIRDSKVRRVVLRRFRGHLEKA